MRAVGRALRPPSTGRAVIADNTHSPAPYTIVDNDQRLLDATDLIFVDSPSRVSGKDNEKAFYGVDADAYAFAEFAIGFLSKYARVVL